MISLEKIKIYADGANIDEARIMIDKYHVNGFTTNPTLMRKAGIVDYEIFAKEFARRVYPLPVSFEVFADEFSEMEYQAHKIYSWGNNIYIKIPIMNTKEISSAPLIKKLASHGVRINVTAVFTKEQIDELAEVFDNEVPSIISIFAGRIADTGQDPAENIRYAVEKFNNKKNIEILWASPREIYNVVQAMETGAHIITVPNDLFFKFSSFGKDLREYSRETIQQFREDALRSGYIIQ